MCYFYLKCTNVRLAPDSARTRWRTYSAPSDPVAWGKKQGGKCEDRKEWRRRARKGEGKGRWKSEQIKLRLAVFLMRCCNRQQVRNRQVRVWQVQVSGKLYHYRITVPWNTVEQWSCAICILFPARLWTCHATALPRRKTMQEEKGRRQKEKKNDSEGSKE